MVLNKYERRLQACLTPVFAPLLHYAPIQAQAFQEFSFPHVSPSNPVRNYPISIRATRGTHLVFLDLISRLTIRDQQKLLSSWF
jgi:hypothetical protein